MPHWFPADANQNREREVMIDHTVVYDGLSNGYYWVRAGAFTMNGIFRGTLKVSSREACHVSGLFNGKLSVLDGATVYVHSILKGEITVAKGGTLILMDKAMINAKIDAAGTVVDQGALILSRRSA